MSLKVLSVTVPSAYGKAIAMPLEGLKPWTFTCPYSARFRCIIDGVEGDIYCNIQAGYKTDFCSAPFIVKRWIPQFKDEPQYDICAAAHDVGYGLKGRCLGLDRSLSANELDDLLRGGWREAGVPRLAAAMEMFLPFAHTKLHWGADQYKCRDKAELVWIHNGKE